MSKYKKKLLLLAGYSSVAGMLLTGLLYKFGVVVFAGPSVLVLIFLMGMYERLDPHE